MVVLQVYVNNLHELQVHKVQVQEFRVYNITAQKLQCKTSQIQGGSGR